ncbi:hypothetical protein D3C74_438550 [compost metagenome]
MSAAKRIKGRFDGFFANAATLDRKSTQLVNKPAQYRNLEQLRLGHVLHLASQLNSDGHRIKQTDVVGAQQHSAFLRHILFPYNLKRKQNGVNEAKQSTAYHINHKGFLSPST